MSEQPRQAEPARTTYQITITSAGPLAVTEARADEPGQPTYRYQNALKWLRMITGLHYFGQAFDPEHMRDLANIAGDALAGRDIKDFDEAMAEGMDRAQKLAAKWGHDLAEEGRDT